MKFEMKHIVIILCIVVAGYILWTYFAKEKFGCGCGAKEYVKHGDWVYSEKKYTDPKVIHLGINPLHGQVDHPVPHIPGVTRHHPAIHTAPAVQQSMEERIKQALKAEEAKIEADIKQDITKSEAVAKQLAEKTKKYIGDIVDKPLQKIKAEYATIKRKMTIENIIIVILLVVVIGFILYKFILSKKITSKIDTTLESVSEKAKGMSENIKRLFRKGYHTVESTTSDIVRPVGRFVSTDIIAPTKRFARDITGPVRRSFADIKPVQTDILGRL